MNARFNWKYRMAGMVLSFLMVFCLFLEEKPMTAKAELMQIVYLDLNVSMDKDSKEVTCQVELKNNPGIAGISYFLLYDGDVLSVEDVSLDDFFSDAIVNKSAYDKTADMSAVSIVYAKTSNMSYTGPIFTVKFKITDDKAESTNLILSHMSVCDENIVKYRPRTNLVDLEFGRSDMKDEDRYQVRGNGDEIPQDNRKYVEDTSNDIGDVYNISAASSDNDDNSGDSASQSQNQSRDSQDKTGSLDTKANQETASASEKTSENGGNADSNTSNKNNSQESGQNQTKDGKDAKDKTESSNSETHNKRIGLITAAVMGLILLAAAFALIVLKKRKNKKDE